MRGTSGGGWRKEQRSHCFGGPVLRGGSEGFIFWVTLPLLFDQFLLGAECMAVPLMEMVPYEGLV